MDVLSVTGSPRASLMETTCGTMLRQLQQIWAEIGESEAEKDQMLLELEKECMAVYRRKVNEASKAKVSLHQAVAAKEAELASLIAVLGENIHFSSQPDKRLTSLKEQLAFVSPLVEELKAKKDERAKQFADVKIQIEKITGELSCCSHVNDTLIMDEQDFSLRNLNEYQEQLRSLQMEKSDRLQKIFEYVNEVHQLCGVLALDFVKTLNEMHPNLHDAYLGQATDISDGILDSLAQTIDKLRKDKTERALKLKDVVASLLELWNLIDSSEEERSKFTEVTSIMDLPEQEITFYGVLSLEMIEQVSAEVERLNKFKMSRTKELILRKRVELEEICSQAHIEPDICTASEKTNALIDSGIMDPSELLSTIGSQIIEAKEELLSRKEIMDRIGKWIAICEEENWLEEYNQDENRYSAGKGGHINLKRAEKARLLVTKIPSVVDNLRSKVYAWESERNLPFLYDGVRLVTILEEYKLARQRREEEKKQLQNRKKLQELLIAEREAIYGSKPSPRKTNSFKKLHGNTVSHGSVTPRRLSMNGAHAEIRTPNSCSGRQNGLKEARKLSNDHLNFVAIPKDDIVSSALAYGPDPESLPQS